MANKKQIESNEKRDDDRQKQVSFIEYVNRFDVNM